ncbi:HEAT repeat domain-containing protein [Nitrosopumilus cobalaminigenes]|uniref:HEAT repeat domain-containing protein n=1 Tax=Nitrosopumilus cobalaminigenes TaxID=1470066 RepID=UPI001FE691D6|nr:HEAT repeat domain-containing protein [Nitrosopumilus cobalaminigenes]
MQILVFNDNLKLKGDFLIKLKIFEKFEPLLTRKKEISQNLENISKVLELGSSKEKIKILETLDNIDNPEILEKIISKLDDDDVEVRGEAFSSLILNKNKISDFLITSLDAANKNIRGFTSLVLANRNETDAIPEIIKLAKDERSMVRSCALGALGHLKAQEAKEIFLEGLSDTNLEVKKSALQAIIDLKISISDEKIRDILKEKDHEIEKMISLIKK